MRHRLPSIALFAIVLGLLLLYACWRHANAPWNVTPKVQTNHTYYFPSIAKPIPSSKIGVGLTYSQCEDARELNVSWEYDWSVNPPNCPGIENIGMIWGEYAVNLDVTGNSEYILGFNEPDLAEQSDIAPELAATLWREIERKYPDKQLVAPAPSQLHPTWLVEFRDSYIAQFGAPPRLDALAMHWYGWTADDAINLIKYYESLARDWGINQVWLTEFAFPTSENPACPVGQFEQAVPEYFKLIQYLENDPMIARYAWFAARIRGDEWWAGMCNASLINPITNKLTDWGKLYSGNFFP